MPQGATTLLEGLCVLDLAAEPAAMCGRILADLGASVVRAEPPEGHPLRGVAPFAPDGTSLRFFAWSAGTTLVRVGGPDDPALARLMRRAHVVLTTPGWPGTMAVARSEAGPAVWVEVTPFGGDGPRSPWRASDLGIMAATGNMYCTGDPDRAPIRCAEPASYAHGSAETALAVLSAVASCRPQEVDVSFQEAVMVASMGAAGRAGHTGERGQRLGADIGATREIWPCRDGWVSFGLRGGKARQANLETITRLVAEDGLPAEALTGRDWAAYDHTRTPPEELAAISEAVAAYFARHTMAELYETACATNLMLAPVNSPAELVGSAQLAARGFFGPLGPAAHFPLRFGRVAGPEGGPEQLGARAAPAELDASEVAWPEGGSSPLEWNRASRERTVELASLGRAAPAREGAWAGTRLLELGSGAAGPIATRYFAEHGATVIRIESSSRPDFLRVYGLRAANPCGLDGSDLFDALNPGKLSVTINLKHEAGVALFRRLVQWADAIEENFAPRALRNLGLDYERLSAEKPDLVMVSSCLMGQTGPHRDYPGFGGQGSALAGYNFLTGWPDREPVGPYGTITDSLAPRFAATALAAGLLYRRRTGRGVHLDLSQVECAVYSLSPWILDHDVNGRTRGRHGNRSERFVPHGVFPCRGDDRWLAVACWDDAMWQRLAELLGDVPAAWGTLEGRAEEIDGVEARLAAFTAERDAEELAEELQARGVEAVPVADFTDAWADPSLAGRGHFVDLEHGCLGRRTYERNGFRLGASPSGFERASPLLGEHTEAVLTGILGLDPRAIGELREVGALD